MHLEQINQLHKENPHGIQLKCTGNYSVLCFIEIITKDMAPSALINFIESPLFQGTMSRMICTAESMVLPWNKFVT